MGLTSRPTPAGQQPEPSAGPQSATGPEPVLLPEPVLPPEPKRLGILSGSRPNR